MIRKTQQDFDTMMKSGNIEAFTGEEVAKHFNQKFEDFNDFEKSSDAEASNGTLDIVKAELSDMIGIQIIGAPENKDSFDKSLTYKTMYVRDRVFDVSKEERIEKSVDGGEDTTKDIQVGTYRDTQLNRTLDRVGEKFDISAE